MPARPSSRADRSSSRHTYNTRSKLALTLLILSAMADVMACSSGGGSAASDGGAADGTANPRPAAIHGSDFDQTCTLTDDCVVVGDGPCCNTCKTDSVSRKGLDAFNTAYAKQDALCTPQDRQCAAFACNAGAHAACIAGKCTFVDSSSDAGGD